MFLNINSIFSQQLSRRHFLQYWAHCANLYIWNIGMTTHISFFPNHCETSVWKGCLEDQMERGCLRDIEIRWWDPCPSYDQIHIFKWEHLTSNSFHKMWSQTSSKRGILIYKLNEVWGQLSLFCSFNSFYWYCSV